MQNYLFTSQGNLFHFPVIQLLNIPYPRDFLWNELWGVPPCFVTLLAWLLSKVDHIHLLIILDGHESVIPPDQCPRTPLPEKMKSIVSWEAHTLQAQCTFSSAAKTRDLKITILDLFPPPSPPAAIFVKSPRLVSESPQTGMIGGGGVVVPFSMWIITAIKAVVMFSRDGALSMA
jgi:hypothetical protein